MEKILMLTVDKFTTAITTLSTTHWAFAFLVLVTLFHPPNQLLSLEETERTKTLKGHNTPLAPSLTCASQGNTLPRQPSHSTGH